jgi:hypothetical protein
MFINRQHLFEVQCLGDTPEGQFQLEELASRGRKSCGFLCSRETKGHIALEKSQNPGPVKA